VYGCDVDVGKWVCRLASAKLSSFELSEDHTGAKAFDTASGQSYGNKHYKFSHKPAKSVIVNLR
jgi:hypothetical protein